MWHATKGRENRLENCKSIGLRHQPLSKKCEDPIGGGQEQIPEREVGKSPRMLEKKGKVSDQLMETIGMQSDFAGQEKARKKYGDSVLAEPPHQI